MNEIINKYIEDVVNVSSMILKHANLNYTIQLESNSDPITCYFTIENSQEYRTYLYFRFTSVMRHPIVDRIDFHEQMGNCFVIYFLDGDELKKFIRKEKLRKLFQKNTL